MADTLHLEKRKGIYHYRRRVPDELIAAIGKKTIKQSLKTTTIAEARKLRNLLDVRWDDEFQRAAAGLATGSQQTISPHTGGKDANGIGRTDVISRVQDYVNRELTRFEGELLESPLSLPAAHFKCPRQSTPGRRAQPPYRRNSGRR